MLSIILKIQNYIDICINILILIFKSKFKNANVFNDGSFNGGSIVVAMNGPTLLDDLKRLPIELAENAIYFTANHFADIEHYTILQPQLYMFSDPYFWRDDVSEDLIIKRDKTFHNISTKTNWPLSIYVTSENAKQLIQKKVASNKFITLKVFNGSGYPVNYNSFVSRLWRSSLVAPFAQNVIIHCLYISIMLRASNVAIVGANFSFHQSIEVDQTNNDFYKVRRHVYGEHKEHGFKDYTKTEKAHVIDEYEALFRAYKSLQALRCFADSLEVNIVNYTTKSYLDMFLRPH